MGRLSPDRFRKPSETVHLVRKEISHLIHQAIKSPSSAGIGGSVKIAKNRPRSRHEGTTSFGLDADGSLGSSTLIGAISLTSEVVPTVAINDDEDSDVNYDDAFEVDEPAAEPASSSPVPSREMIPMPDHLVSKAEQYWNCLVKGKHIIRVDKFRFALR